MTAKDLIDKGYTVGAAARAISSSKTHVYYVVTGKRISISVLEALKKLPVRPMQLREKLTR